MQKLGYNQYVTQGMKPPLSTILCLIPSAEHVLIVSKEAIGVA